MYVYHIKNWCTILRFKRVSLPVWLPFYLKVNTSPKTEENDCQESICSNKIMCGGLIAVCETKSNYQIIWIYRLKNSKIQNLGWKSWTDTCIFLWKRKADRWL